MALTTGACGPIPIVSNGLKVLLTKDNLTVLADIIDPVFGPQQLARCQKRMANSNRFSLSSSAGGNPPQVSELSWSFLVACDGYDVISFSNEFIRFDNELINFINELINNFDCPLPRILLRRKLGPVPLEERRGKGSPPQF